MLDLLDDDVLRFVLTYAVRDAKHPVKAFHIYRVLLGVSKWFGIVFSPDAVLNDICNHYDGWHATVRCYKTLIPDVRPDDDVVDLYLSPGYSRAEGTIVLVDPTKDVRVHALQTEKGFYAFRVDVKRCIERLQAVGRSRRARNIQASDVGTRDVSFLVSYDEDGNVCAYKTCTVWGKSLYLNTDDVFDALARDPPLPMDINAVKNVSQVRALLSRDVMQAA